jgi:uncharacterized protein (TIGR01777 family)
MNTPNIPETGTAGHLLACTVAVSGANGMVGRRLVDALLTRGDKVIALVRDPEHAQFPHGVDVRRWQASDPIAPLAGADAVVNLVGSPIMAQPWTDARKQELIENRLTAVRSIIEGIRQTQNNVKTFLSSSAVEYSGDTGDQITDETTAPGRGFLADMAQKWEAAAGEAVPLGVRVVVMRHGLVLGSDGATFASLAPIFRRGFGGTLGRPNSWVSWIHVDDDVRLALQILDHEETSGPVVFAAPNPVTQREFAHAFGRALNKPALVPMPPFVLRLMYGERANLFLDSHRAMPRQALDSRFTYSFPTIEAALRDLDKKSSERTRGTR